MFEHCFSYYGLRIISGKSLEVTDVMEMHKIGKDSAVSGFVLLLGGMSVIKGGQASLKKKRKVHNIHSQTFILQNS